MELVLVALLVAQGVMGGIDTLLNHEIIARLPHRAESRGELGLHVLREANYALIFGGLAWFTWEGWAAAMLAALFAAEIAITAFDELVENRTRVLPQNERVLHVFLTLNLGMIVAVAVPLLWQWFARPTGWQGRSFGGLSWALTVLALAGAMWAVRDFIARSRLKQRS
ncbi:MAG TPA: hypothetical protein VM122_06640 [Usitatibacter sp.]|nr:hypothetical protein [Usitatibacter sp.]